VTNLARTAAAIVALSAWAGLGLQFVDSYQLAGNRPIAALWFMLEYFTITTNILVAVAFTALAFGYTVTPRALGGIMLSIVLVGVIYNTLLRDIPIGNAPTSALANTLVHRVTPILVPLFWIAFVTKGQLQWQDALWWAAYPIAYLVYVLVRGHFTQHYPYPFINVASIGWQSTWINAAGIAIAFIASSCILIGIDRVSTKP
jgi:hypothetical protein